VIWIIILQPKTATDTYRWKTLLPYRIKCNVDDSFVRNKVGIGVCLRDDSGAYILGKTQWFLPKFAIHVNEALDILSVLGCGHKLTLEPIDFDLDSIVGVDRFLSTKQDVRVWGYY